MRYKYDNFYFKIKLHNEQIKEVINEAKEKGIRRMRAEFDDRDPMGVEWGDLFSPEYLSYRKRNQMEEE